MNYMFSLQSGALLRIKNIHWLLSPHWSVPDILWVKKNEQKPGTKWTKWGMFAAEWGVVCVTVLEHPSDERAGGNWHLAASETTLTIWQLGEEAWALCESCYCSAWLNKRRDEVGRLTDEVGTSLVSMHWSCGELEPVKQTAPRSSPSPSCQQSITHWRRQSYKCCHYSHHMRLWSARQYENRENILLLIYPEPITVSTAWPPGLITKRQE